MFLWRGVSGASWVSYPEKKRREFCILSQVVFCLYDIRMTTIIILVLIIILYPHQYLLMKMKWMYLTLYSVNTWNWINFFFHSWRGRSQSDVWNVRVEFATKTLLPWRTDICCLSKVTCMSEKWVWVCACARVWETKKKKCRYLGLWFHFWSFWKVFLFFITGVFTVQIVFMKNPMDTILFFKYKCS